MNDGITPTSGSVSKAYVETLEATNQRLQATLDKAQAELTALKGETNKPRAWGATPITPEKGDVWQHQSSGHLYTVECLANTASDKAEFPIIVIYVGPNGLLWARPLSDWHRSFGNAPVGNKPVGHAEKRETFGIPDGLEAVRDAYLRATGDVKKVEAPAFTLDSMRKQYDIGYGNRKQGIEPPKWVQFTPDTFAYDKGWQNADLTMKYQALKEKLAELIRAS